MKDDPSDIIIEYLEIFINSILYVRELYPKDIFKKFRIYNTSVNISIYPPLNEFLLPCLKAAYELKNDKLLKKIKIIIYSEDFSKIYEKYIIEINDEQQYNYSKSNDNDLYLIQFEEELRKSLILLEERVKILDKLPSDATFKIHLTTTEKGFIKMSQKPELQEYPWLLDTASDPPLSCENSQDKIKILPLVRARATGIQVYAEKS